MHKPDPLEAKYIQVPQHIYQALLQLLRFHAPLHDGSILKALELCEDIPEVPKDMISLYYNNFRQALDQTKAHLQNAACSLDIVDVHFKELKK